MTTAVTAPNTLEMNSLSMSPGQNLDGYISAVRQFEVLTVEEERALAERFYYDEDLDAARELVLHHLRFVVHLARSYAGYGLPLGDLVQEGNVGLMKAVKRFDPSVGVRLVSFAVHWIKAEMHEFILRNWRIVKVATTKAQRKLFFNLRGAKQKLAWFSNDEAKAVADDLGVPVAAVNQMEGRLASHDVAFDGYGSSDDEEAPSAPMHYLEDRSTNPEDLVIEENFRTDSEARLAEALELLDERSQNILRARWLTEKKKTLHELAAEYSVSAERIRQLEQNAIKKLRKQLAA